MFKTSTVFLCGRSPAVDSNGTDHTVFVLDRNRKPDLVPALGEPADPVDTVLGSAQSGASVGGIRSEDWSVNDQQKVAPAGETLVQWWCTGWALG